MTDINLITCKCGKGSTACLETKTEDATMWNCFTCGYHSSTLMKKDSDFITTVEETQPEIIKNSKFIDDDGNIWYPKCVITNKHMLFCDGPNESEWKWAAVSLEEGEVKLPNGEVKVTNKPNFKEAKYFNKYDYMDALEYIDFFKK
jgi:hypothetical protein